MEWSSSRHSIIEGYWRGQKQKGYMPGKQTPYFTEGIGEAGANGGGAMMGGTGKVKPAELGGGEEVKEKHLEMGRGRLLERYENTQRGGGRD